MKVTLIGKEYIKGTSKKTGKPFEANIAHITRPDRSVDGQKGDTVWLEPSEFPLDTLIVGGTYDLERDGRGFLICFNHVK